MNPRLPSSKQWTTLPEEFTSKAAKVFADNFKEAAKEGEFLVSGRIYPEEVLLRIGYLENGRLRQVNFEASMGYDPEKKDAVDRIYNCIDAAGSMAEQYFTATDDEDLDFPLHWRAYQFEEGTVFLQYSTVNTRLEEEADRLLGMSESALVHDHGEEEDALARAVVDNDLAFHVRDQIRKGSGVN